MEIQSRESNLITRFIQFWRMILNILVNINWRKLLCNVKLPCSWLVHIFTIQKQHACCHLVQTGPRDSLLYQSNLPGSLTVDSSGKLFQKVFSLQLCVSAYVIKAPHMLHSTCTVQSLLLYSVSKQPHNAHDRYQYHNTFQLNGHFLHGYQNILFLCLLFVSMMGDGDG